LFVFFLSSFGHFIVSPSSICGSWLPLVFILFS
jgi:hypothetical protein